MADFYFVRHGSNDYLGWGLAGRKPGVHLNAQGRTEAARVADALGRLGLGRIVSSPLERARETAEPLAARLGLPVEIAEEIHEIDFGVWTGMSMRDLEASEEWKRFNSYRSGTRIPQGETMLEAQARMVGYVERLRREAPEAKVALFSHGDPIKSVFAYFLGVPLDLFTRLEISPGSFSVLRLEHWGPQILAINNRP